MIGRTALILTVVALLVATMLTMALPALAAPTKPIDPTGTPEDPNCWGEVTQQFTELSPGIVGAHSSDPIPGDEDRETPRDGVGNVSREDNNPDGDRPSDHGEDVGLIVLGPNPCTDSTPGAA
jgi:hypothetical protein